MCYFSSEAKKSPFFEVLTDFLFLVKSKMAAKVVTIVGDDTGPQQRHHP